MFRGFTLTLLQRSQKNQEMQKRVNGLFNGYLPAGKFSRLSADSLILQDFHGHLYILKRLVHWACFHGSYFINHIKA